ncbi:MAG: MFS transporter [Chloroflexota bacterium]
MASLAGVAAVAPRFRTRVSGNLSDTFDSLRVRDYRLLFQGSAVTSIGFWMQQAALGWLVLDLTNSPFYLGLASFARQFPMMIVSPFGGVLADRLDRKQLLIWTQVVQLVLCVILSALVFSGLVNIWHVLGISFLFGAAVSFNVPARQAIVPVLVGRERLVNALALYSMSLNASRILGPTLAGVMMGWAGVGGCLALQSLGYLWAAGSVFHIKDAAGMTNVPSGASVTQNLIDGLRFCVRTRPIFMQLLMAAVPSVVAYPYMQFLPAFARDVYGIGPGGLGVLMTAMGVGALSGSFALASWKHIPHKNLVTLACAATFGLFLCGFAVSPSLPYGLICLALAGASSSVYMTLNGTIIQELTPDEYRGRVSSVYMMTWGMMPIGAVPAGAIAEVWGAPTAVFIGGAICAVFTGAMLLTGVNGVKAARSATREHARA